MNLNDTHGVVGFAPGESRDEAIGGSAVLPAGSKQPLKVGPAGVLDTAGRIKAVEDGLRDARIAGVGIPQPGQEKTR